MSFQRTLESSYLINSSYKALNIDTTDIPKSLDSSLRWNDMCNCYPDLKHPEKWTKIR